MRILCIYYIVLFVNPNINYTPFAFRVYNISYKNALKPTCLSKLWIIILLFNNFYLYFCCE